MNTPSPFSFLESFAARFQPPFWVVRETQQRLILLINHVVMQEREAQDRLARKKGSRIHVNWGSFSIDLLITPAGLLDLGDGATDAAAKPDLLLSVASTSPAVAVQSMLTGKSPDIKIEGDVQLAAELGWLADNLRWDIEEDLSRVIGDVAANTLVRAARQIAAGVKSFVVSAASSPLNPLKAHRAGTSTEQAAPGTPTAGEFSL